MCARVLCASVCVCESECGSLNWKPLHSNATQTDFKVTLYGYTKTWVAVRSPLASSSSLVGSLAVAPRGLL